MSSSRAADFPREVLELFDHLVHGRVTRREFLDRAAGFATGSMTAAAMLAALLPDYARAVQVEESDFRIFAGDFEYDSPAGHGRIRGHLAAPADEGRHPGVVVVHENRGLNPYIADVARRLAVAGFVALAPDGLTPKGGYPGTDVRGRELQAELDPEKLVADFAAAARTLAKHPRCTGKVGVVGFCFGGWVSNRLAAMLPELEAAVPFYGRQVPAAEVPAIRAPLLLHFAETDPRVNEGWPAYRAALEAAGKRFTAHTYPGTNHGFHNDSTPRYDRAAAELAWERTLAFFRAELR